MIQDTFYTLIPLNRALRIFALSNVKRVKSKLVQSWSLTDTLILLTVTIIINSFLLYNKIRRFEGYLKKESLKFTDALQLTYLFEYAGYVVHLVYVYKTRKTCLKYLLFYNSIDKILGAPDFEAIRSRNLVSIIVLIVSYLVSSSIDYACWCVGYGWKSITLYSIDYLYNFINSLTILDFISNVTHIEYRLNVMVAIIKEFYSSSLSLGGAVEDHWTFGPVAKHMKVNHLRTVSYNKNFGILLLSKCYILLLEQVNYINHAYGKRVIAYCLILLMNLIYLTNIIIRIMLGLYRPPNTVIYNLPALSTMLRVMNYAAVLQAMVHRCQQTYKQCDNIVRLIDLAMVNKKISPDMKTALLELRVLVISRPVKFYADHFFALDCPLLVSVASVVVTYTMILLQNLS